jgi:hypothetical protein
LEEAKRKNQQLMEKLMQEDVVGGSSRKRKHGATKATLDDSILVSIYNSTLKGNRPKMNPLDLKPDYRSIYHVFVLKREMCLFTKKGAFKNINRD